MHGIWPRRRVSATGPSPTLATRRRARSSITRAGAERPVRSRAIHAGWSGPVRIVDDAHALLDCMPRPATIGDKALALGVLRSLSSAVADSPRSAINATRDFSGSFEKALQNRSRPAPILLVRRQPSRRLPPRRGLRRVERVVVSENSPAELQLALHIAPQAPHLRGRPRTTTDPARPADSSLSASDRPWLGRRGVRRLPGRHAVGSDPAVMVHTGTLELRVALERQGEWRGRPLLSSPYQACTDNRVP